MTDRAAWTRGVARLLFLMVCALWWPVQPDPAVAAPPTGQVMHFSLVDHTGRKVTEGDYHGRYTLVYFGYTFCPDICPLDLQNISQALGYLGAGADKLQVLFITLDPKRDTIANMADYVSLFHPGMVGLTGSPKAVARAARAFDARYEVWGDPAGDSYQVDHTAYIYLLDGAGRLERYFHSGAPPEQIAAVLARYLRKGN